MQDMHAWDCPCGTRNHPTLTACRNCGRAHRAGQPPPPRAAVPLPLPAPAAPRAARPLDWRRSPKVGAALGTAALVLLAALWAVASSGALNRHEYQVRVRCLPAPFAWSGTYGVTGASGSSSRTVEGTGDQPFDAGSGEITSAVFQKRTEPGVLTLEIWRDGALVKSESTSAEYGTVSLSD